MSAVDRRTILESAAALALAQTGLAGAATAPAAKPPGKPGDFDFLQGQWRIAHRWRQKVSDPFIEFPGEATCWTILSGLASIEELRIPARDFFGMGLRLLDLEQKVWSDYWMNAKSGVLGRDGVPGYFENGAGIFDSADKDDQGPFIVRGRWDRIVPGVSHRWSQQVSRDGGKSWQDLWLMDWTRA